jgi:hypothetical protein
MSTSPCRIKLYARGDVDIATYEISHERAMRVPTDSIIIIR